jgi:hypothetical protein
VKCNTWSFEKHLMKPRHVPTQTKRPPDANTAPEAIERIYHDWDEALSRNDPEGLLALYARDGSLESPLVPHLLKKERGICEGHAELRALFEELAKRKPKAGSIIVPITLLTAKRSCGSIPAQPPRVTRWTSSK